MAKNLVIVESPSKWKTIEKFLWKDYKVVASMWHIRDLPRKNLWVDIEDDFKPDYQISDEKKKTADNLKRLAKSHDTVWIATDEDREWEAIGWHICHLLDLDPTKVKRIAFHEITKKAITEAVKNPKKININLVDAQQARRVLDRLVWYKVSPILWKKIRKGLSAWRVQSVAVKLIVEKEKTIKAFKPEESWKIWVEMNYEKYKFQSFLSKINGKVKKLHSQEDVMKVLSTLYSNIEDIKTGENKRGFISLSKNENLEFKLVDATKKDSKRSPKAPFTTSTLQQEAARKFGFSVKQTMMVAQRLYEWIDLGNGERQWLITYMRTDSVHLSDEAKGAAKTMIDKLYGKQYHKSRKYKTKAAGAQEAHEAIRPVDITKTPDSFKNDLDKNQLKLLTLIWNRTVSSQMEDAIVEVTTFHFSPTSAENQLWLTKWEVIKFEGFMKVYIEGTDDINDEEEDTSMLPDLKVWDTLTGKNLLANQAFSRPPARYTEASLVKKLEQEWIGRPSTYAPTISTIIDRGYVEKEKRYLGPTDTAFTVTEFLEKYFVNMMDYKFTSIVEQDFDKIAAWDETYGTMLGKFWEWTLKKDLLKADENAEKVVEMVWKDCPKCGEGLVFKYSKWGKFIGCSGYPECKHIDQPEEEKNALDALKAKYEWKPCPDGIEGTIVVKTGRYGAFLASSNYPKVKWIGKIKTQKEDILDRILSEKGLLVDEETGEELVVKNSRRWPFLAAKNYPAVKIAKNIPKDVWELVNAELAEITQSEAQKA